MNIFPWSKKKRFLQDEFKDSNKLEGSKRYNSVDEMLADLTSYRPSFIERIVISFKYRYRDYLWAIYRFFKPAHSRIRKVIPRRFCDLTELTLLVNFEIVKSFVEEEMEIINWESDSNHKAAHDWLMFSYDYITKKRPEIEKELTIAYEKVDLKKDQPYLEKYQEVLKLENLIEENDKSVLVGLANYRGYLWS